MSWSSTTEVTAIKISEAWSLGIRAHRRPLDLPDGFHFQMLKVIQCHRECYHAVCLELKSHWSGRALKWKKNMFSVWIMKLRFLTLSGKESVHAQIFWKVISRGRDEVGPQWTQWQDWNLKGQKSTGTCLPLTHHPELLLGGQRLIISGPGFQFSNSQ